MSTTDAPLLPDGLYLGHNHANGYPPLGRLKRMERTDDELAVIFEIDGSAFEKITKSEAVLPEPSPKEGKDIVFKAFMHDIEERAEFGIMKYNTYLKTFNGRDALKDAYQEAIDLCLYLKQVLMERDDIKGVK